MATIIAVRKGLSNRQLRKEIKKILLGKGIDTPFHFRRLGENFRGDVEFVKVFVKKPRKTRPKLVIEKAGVLDYRPMMSKKR